MRRLISALAASALMAAAGISSVPATAVAASPPQLAEPASLAIHPRWGALADLAGREWSGNRQRHRFVWSDEGRTLTWEVAAAQGSSWAPYYIFTDNEAGVTAQLAGGRSRGPVSVDADGSALARVGDLGATTRFVRDGEGFRIVFRPIPVTWRLTLQADGWTGETSQQAAASEPAPRQPSAPIIVAAAPEPTPPRRSGRSSRNAPPAQPVATPAPAVPRAEADRPAGPGPIVIASAPPPPAAMREPPRSAGSPRGGQAPAPTSREARMQAEVEARRLQAARQAEAERQRQAQLAEERRMAEQRRREQEQSRGNAWGEAFAFVGAIAGGLVAGSATGGDMTAITAGMAVGGQLGGSETEIAAATNTNFQAERQRYEAEQAAQRELEARTLAAMNDPNNPLTQQARREDAAREERAQARRVELETREREAREAAEREALERERDAERQASDQRAREARSEAEQRAAEERREAERRRQEAERLRAEREEQQRRREEEARAAAERRAAEQRAEQQRREAERAAAEAERNRLVDFREAVVLCSLSGEQARFGNWRCEGPLQMNYVNFDRPNAASAMRLVGCTNYRELPTAGTYRAFGCGYGLHPTNPAPNRNVPEMLGVFVDGRAIFRCPVSSTGTCNTR